MKKQKENMYGIRSTWLGFMSLMLIMLALNGCTGSSQSEGTAVSSANTVSVVQGTQTVSLVFSLKVPGVNGAVTLVPDADMDELLPLLGDSYSYYEAPSCAFHGLDKIYTFNDFEIDTYPDGETDRIYLISLLSDMVMTNEGLMIGASEALIVSTYGEPQEKRGNEYIYIKDSVKLGIVAQNGLIAAITYYSTIE